MRLLGGGMTAFLSIAVSACSEAPPTPKTTVRLPEEVCKQAREGLDKLAAGSGFEVVKAGEAVIAEQAWLDLPPDTRNQLAQLIGYDAACRASEASSEQTVVIRNEMGRVITERIVPTSADFSNLLKE